MHFHRSIRATLTAALAGTLSLGCAMPDADADAEAAPPGVPSAETARSQLAELTVAPEGSMNGYDRDKFPHWGTAPGDNCNVREHVLQRDGTNVEVGNDCYPTSGTWDSAYDDGTWTDPSDLDIDHVVPLGAAWRSGAADWTTTKRERFANDIEGPQLIAVTDNVNQAKGDDTPDEWLPPDTGFHCTYAAMWVGSKYDWKLTVTRAERTALSDVLSGC